MFPQIRGTTFEDFAAVFTHGIPLSVLIRRSVKVLPDSI